MNYFQLLSGCNSQALSIILNISKQLLNLIQIIGPILLIISLGYTFVKMMQHPDDKKLINRLKNSALALILVFFIPLLVNVVMNMTDGSSQFSACWKENTNINLSPSYIETTENNNRKPITSNPSEYEQGTPQPSPSSSTSSSSSSNNSNSSGTSNSNSNNSGSYDNTPLPSEGIISGDLEIHFIDPKSRVDAIYIKAGNRSIFVDGGYKADGKREIEYLKKIGVSKIDYYIGTHSHKNHVEAAPAIINTFGIKNVLVGRNTCSSCGSTPAAWQAIQNHASSQKISLSGVNVRTLKPGDSFSLAGLKITCIGPITVDNSLAIGDTSQNYNSLILILEYGSVSIALTGDNSSSTQVKKSKEAYPSLIDVDVLKNPHHNGNCSNSLYNAFSPKYVVFTTMDGYLPTSDLLNKLKNLGVSKSYIVAESKDGNVVFSTNGTTMNFKTRHYS